MFDDDDKFGAIATGLLGTVALFGIGKLIKSGSEKRKAEAEEKAEENRRKNTPCHFDNGITEDSFRNIVYYELKAIKRMEEVQIVGPVVTVTMRSQSGATNWDFTIDFNDFGQVTGQYWHFNQNEESLVPDKVAENISKTLINYLSQKQIASVNSLSNTQPVTISTNRFCPACGKKLLNGAQFCGFCGVKV